MGSCGKRSVAGRSSSVSLGAGGGAVESFGVSARGFAPRHCTWVQGTSSRGFQIIIHVHRIQDSDILVPRAASSVFTMGVML